MVIIPLPKQVNWLQLSRTLTAVASTATSVEVKLTKRLSHSPLHKELIYIYICIYIYIYMYSTISVVICHSKLQVIQNQPDGI